MSVNSDAESQTTGFLRTITSSSIRMRGALSWLERFVKPSNFIQTVADVRSIV